jgi:hypothetical protein
MNFAMTPEMLAQLRANMGVPPIPPPIPPPAPTLRETLRAETPTLRRGAELAGRGAKAAWSIAKPALPFGVGAAIPAMELYREWDVIGDPEAPLGDRLAATGRTAARTALTGGGLLLGSRVGHPYVGAGIGGALAAALVPGRDEPAALPGIGSAEAAPPPVEAPPKDDGFRFYNVPPNSPAQAAQTAQAAGPGPVTARPVEGQLMPRTSIDWTQINRERERMDELMNRYAASSGEKVPSKLNAMDKFQILAKGLGVAAVMSAFPGFGLLAMLGAGALGAGDELGRRRAALAKGDSDARAEERQRMKDLMGMSAAQTQNVMDMTKMNLAREDEAYQRLDRNRRYNLDAQKALAAGYQPVQAADGSLVYWNPATGAQIKAPGQPVASSKGVSFSVPGAINQRADLFLRTGQADTADEALRMAQESLAPELAVQGIRLPVRQPAGFVPGFLKAYQESVTP